MATLKITQIKSRIGSTAQQCKNLDALGLHRINHTVTHSDSAIILGMLNKVKHLVKVEVVEEKAPAKKAVKAEAPAVEAEVAEAPKAEKKAPAKKAPAKKAEAAEKAPAKKPAAKKVTKTKKEE
ncbi:MAG: 50S ribosomal protein L30 [Rikenellaceae bacterium]|nr:50S ribosomal protein L30 [Rikenellaceae bacterium]